MPMSTFADWNCRLHEYFFCPANAGKSVRLAVNRELLDDEFEDLGGSEDFERAVLSGPGWPTGLTYNGQKSVYSVPRGLRDRAEGAHRDWEEPHKAAPQYPYRPQDGKWL